MRRSTCLWLPLLLAAGCAAEKANGRPWIHDLKIEGVKHVKEKDLKSKIALEDTSWVPLSPKHYLDPFEVDVSAPAWSEPEPSEGLRASR